MIRLPRLAALGLVGTLGAMLVVWSIDAPGHDPIEGDAGRRPPVAAIDTKPPESSRATPPYAEAAPGVASPSSTSSSTVVAEQTVLDVVTAGLEAWGVFAVTGDLRSLDRHFDPTGPQMEQFRQEEPTIEATAPPYRVGMEPGAVEETGDRASVTTTVQFVRTGEPTQRFDWVFELHRNDGRWLIWTVQPAQPSVPD